MQPQLVNLAEPEKDRGGLKMSSPGLTAPASCFILATPRPAQTSVLVTGQGNEELVVEALRLGANDYLVKHEGYLKQLPAVLEKVQKQSELNASEERYRNLSQEFNGLLDAIPDALIGTSERCRSAMVRETIHFGMRRGDNAHQFF